MEQNHSSSRVDTQSSTDKPKALSLFTGAGGLDLGFHEMGFDIVACIEIEPIFCKTLELNRGRYIPEHCKVMCADIQHIEPAELRIGPIDMIVGGPPCQSFSAAGRRAGGVTGIFDVRGALFEHYCRFVDHFRPKAFIFENVRGILQGNKGRDWQEILDRFTALGYTLSYRVLDAADYGVPQHRERLVLVGVEDASFLFPQPTHGVDSPHKLPYVTAFEAIKDLQPEDEPVHEYGGKYGKLLQEVPPGMNYHYFTKEMGYPTPIFAWRSRFSDFLYKADPDKPIKTLVARLGRYSGPFHWKSRKFTFAEFKRLQSFPDDYEFAGTLNVQLRQLGNSVAPRFARAIAAALKAQIFAGNDLVELLPNDYRLSFDRRKSTKARQTRLSRLKAEEKIQRSLFDSTPLIEETLSEDYPINGFGEKTTMDFMYTSLNKKRVLLAHSDFGQEGTFHFELERRDDIIYVGVFKQLRSLPPRPAIEYRLSFKRLIGERIKAIWCCLWTDTGMDIPIAWDAIEMAIRSYSHYHSLMDIFGHFTEPHPIFSLECSVKTLQDDPIVRFAKYFSDFKNTSVALPARKLKEIMGIAGPFDFLEEVKVLRQLRFDVRVHETNLTIPKGMFRCCYPFSLSFDKQIAVSWKNLEHGNRSLVI